MVNAAVDVTTIERIGHDEAIAITTVENRRFLEQLRRFPPAGPRGPARGAGDRRPVPVGRHGRSGDVVRIDTLDFISILARATGTGVLRNPLPL